MTDVGLSQCNNVTERCQEGTHCPPGVGSEPVTCVVDTPIKDCNVTFHGVCKLCNDLYYLENGACFPCDGECTLCKNATICGVCLLPAFMQPTITGECKQTCSNLQNNQFCDDAVPKTCQPGLTSSCKCGTAKNCASCSSSNQCETCLPGFKKAKGQCVQCATGYYQFQGLCLDDGTGNRNPADLDDSTDLINSSNKISTGAIIGIVIGVIILLCILGGGVAWFVIKRKQNVSNSQSVEMTSQKVLAQRFK